MVFTSHFLHSFWFKNLAFYLIHYSSVLRLTPCLGFIYDSLDLFEVDRTFGFPDICVDLQISGKVLADLFGFLARCTRIFGVIHPSMTTTKLTFIAFPTLLWLFTQIWPINVLHRRMFLHAASIEIALRSTAIGFATVFRHCHFETRPMYFNCPWAKWRIHLLLVRS